MDANEYQYKAFLTCMSLENQREALEYCAHGLAGEAGEVSELVKKMYYHGHPVKPEDIMDEISDCLWYCAIMSSKLGYLLEEVMQHNIDKLRARYPEGFSTERSINRNESPEAPDD